MRVYTLQGANIVVGGKRYVFAPSIPVDVSQTVADYLLSTNRFYKEGEIPIDYSSSTYLRPLKIGVSRVGGIGDALLGSCVIEAIHRKYITATIIAHTHSTIQNMWAGHPRLHHIDNAYHPRMNNAPHIVPHYDIFYDLMPDCNISYNPRTSSPEELFFAKQRQTELETYKKRPGCRNHLKPFCDEKKFEALDVYNYAFGLDATIKDMYLRQTPKEQTCYYRFLAEKKIPEKYITIHDWAFNGRQTKSWYPTYWKELNALLKKEYGLPVVQIGGAGEESLHADYDLRGKTTFGESVDILRHAVFHVDNESTPAHVCAAVGTPCAVLCGSTLKYWRHKENLNIVSTYHCQECEGAPNWYKVCEDKGSFGCMKSLTPDYAFERIESFMKTKLK